MSSATWGGGRSESLRWICAMIPPDADGAPTCGSCSSLAAAAGVSNPVSNDGNPVACLMGAQLSAATGRSSDSSAACASAKKSRARKVGSAAPVMFAGEDLMFGGRRLRYGRLRVDR